MTLKKTEFAADEFPSFDDAVIFKRVDFSIATITNEQSSINALISWLYKRSETYIDAFEFKPIKKIDRGDEELRRSIFDETEILQMRVALEEYVANVTRDLGYERNLSKVVTGYYLLISMITGMRRGEQLRLKWKDIEFKTQAVKDATEDDAFNLVIIHIDADISKVKKPCNIYVHEN